jgi:hypothetical protein
MSSGITPPAGTSALLQSRIFLVIELRAPIRDRWSIICSERIVNDEASFNRMRVMDLITPLNVSAARIRFKWRRHGFE